MPEHRGTLFLERHLETTSWTDYRNQVAARNGVRVADQIEKYLRLQKPCARDMCVAYELAQLAEDFRHIFRELVPHRAYDEAMDDLKALTKKHGITLR